MDTLVSPEMDFLDDPVPLDTEVTLDDVETTETKDLEETVVYPD